MSLSEDIKKEWKKYLVGVIMLGLVGFGDKIIDIFNTGAEVEFKNEVATTFTVKEGTPFYNAVDSVVTLKVKDPALISLLLESDEVVEAQHQAALDIRNTIIEDVMKKDTNKISMRSFLGMKTGLRDEDVLPALAKLLDSWEKGELMTKRQADAYVTRKVKSMVDKKSLKETPSF